MRIFFAIILLMAATAHAAFEEKALTARAAGLGETGAALAGDVSGMAVNPAALRFAERKRFASGYTRLFGLSELPLQQFAIQWPTVNHGGWGLTARRFGSGFYQEDDIAFAQSFYLSSATAFGISIHRYGLRVDRYGARTGFGADAGILARVHPLADIGASVLNVSGVGFLNSAEGPVQTLRAGVALRPAQNALTAIDLVKPGSGEFSWRAGEEIRLARPLAFRFGIETNPSRLSLGIGLFLGRLTLDYAMLMHPDLPEQHHVTLSMSWGKKFSNAP